jgi:nicotinate-nucleotide adenylyltransferase
MKIGLYFGSFNPIHVGHLIIANHVVNHTDVEQVWFVVSPQNPLKPSSTLLNEYHRLHFVNLAIANNTRLKASDIEFKLPKPSYTIDSLVYLQEKYPTHQFSIVVGSDSYNNIPNWKNGKLLLTNYQFIVYQRPGYELSNAKETTGCVVLTAPFLDISASYIRKAIKEGKSVRYLMPEAVCDEIEANGYYK